MRTRSLRFAGRRTSRHLVQRDADSPDIGVGSELASHGLLWCHIARRANATSIRSRGAHHAEIEDLGHAVGGDDIGGLEIEVKHVMAV